MSSRWLYSTPDCVNIVCIPDVNPSETRTGAADCSTQPGIASEDRVHLPPALNCWREHAPACTSSWSMHACRCRSRCTCLKRHVQLRSLIGQIRLRISGAPGVSLNLDSTIFRLTGSACMPMHIGRLVASPYSTPDAEVSCARHA